MLTGSDGLAAVRDVAVAKSLFVSTRETRVKIEQFPITCRKIFISISISIFIDGHYTTTDEGRLQKS